MARRKRYLKDKIREYPELVYPSLLGLEEHAGRWREKVFDGREFLHLEIGAGRGLFLTSLAQSRPQDAFLALEIKADRCARIADRAAAAALENLRVLCGKLEALRSFVGEAECQRFWINFPDPWPKRRYAKRRIPRRDFLRDLRAMATPDAWLHLRTDSRALFEWSRDQVHDSGWRVREEPGADEIWTIAKDLHTEYEIGFRDQGLEIHYLHLEATDSAA